MGRAIYSSCSASLGGSGWACVGRTKLPKICFSLFVLFRNQKKCGRDLSLVNKCSILMHCLLMSSSRRRLASLYARQIRR